MAFHNITVFYCTDLWSNKCSLHGEHRIYIYIYIYIWYRMIWLLSDLSLHIITIQISISPHSWRWKITVKCDTCVRRLPSLQSRSYHSFSEEQHQSRHFDPTALEQLVELLPHGCWTSARRTEGICFAPLCPFSPLLCLNLLCFLYTSLWLETAAKHLWQHFKNECISDVSKLGAPSLSPVLPPFVWVCVMWVRVCACMSFF